MPQHEKGNSLSSPTGEIGVPTRQGQKAIKDSRKRSLLQLLESGEEDAIKQAQCLINIELNNPLLDTYLGSLGKGDLDEVCICFVAGYVIYIAICLKKNWKAVMEYDYKKGFTYKHVSKMVDKPTRNGDLQIYKKWKLAKPKSSSVKRLAHFYAS